MKKLLIPGFVASIAIFIAGMAIGYLFDAIAPSLTNEYETFGKFRGWDDPVMYIYFIYPLVLGYILAWMWDISHSHIPGNKLGKVVRFTLVYWIVAVIPGMIMTLSAFQLSVLMIMSWSVSNFFQALFAAIVFASMIKEKE